MEKRIDSKISRFLAMLFCLVLLLTASFIGSLHARR